MKPRHMLAGIAALFALALSSPTHAQAGISLAIEKHAALTEQRALVIRVHIACGPFDGTEEFQESVAGAFQETTGAEAEGGIDGMVVCDGVERTHTAHVSSFTDAVFRRGRAGAGVSLFVCMLVEDEQMCFRGSAQRRVVIRGPLIP